jgi:hypothetical protein
MTSTPPVRVTSYSYADLIKKAEGEDFNKPDIAYEFTNGRKFNNPSAYFAASIGLYIADGYYADGYF